MKGLLTQQALAERVGASQSHICDLEKGKLRNDEVFLKIADELDCTTDFLFRRGRFRRADKPRELRDAVSLMAFEVFLQRHDVTQTERDRCERVLGHPEAPLTATAWKALAEMIERAVSQSPPKVERFRA